MKKHFAPLFLAFVTLASAACESPLLNHADAAPARAGTEASTGDCPLRFPGAGVCARIEWSKGPFDGDESAFRLWFRPIGAPADSEASLADPAPPVSVKLWMPAMRHGSAPVAISHVDRGEFLVTNVYFLMPGPWEIRVTLDEHAPGREEAAYAVNVQ